jgi:hypothetical protein
VVAAWRLLWELVRALRLPRRLPNDNIHDVDGNIGPPLVEPAVNALGTRRVAMSLTAWLGTAERFGRMETWCLRYQQLRW